MVGAVCTEILAWRSRDVVIIVLRTIFTEREVGS